MQTSLKSFNCKQLKFRERAERPRAAGLRTPLWRWRGRLPGAGRGSLGTPRPSPASRSRDAGLETLDGFCLVFFFFFAVYSGVKRFRAGGAAGEQPPLRSAAGAGPGEAPLHAVPRRAAPLARRRGGVTPARCAALGFLSRPPAAPQPHVRAPRRCRHQEGSGEQPRDQHRG